MKFKSPLLLITAAVRVIGLNEYNPSRRTTTAHHGFYFRSSHPAKITN